MIIFDLLLVSCLLCLYPTTFARVQVLPRKPLEQPKTTILVSNNAPPLRIFNNSSGSNSTIKQGNSSLPQRPGYEINSAFVENALKHAHQVSEDNQCAMHPEEEFCKNRPGAKEKLSEPSLEAMDELCLLWDRDCNGDRAKELDAFFEVSELSLLRNQCFMDPLPNCSAHAPPALSKRYEEAKSWMRQPGCILSKSEYWASQTTPSHVGKGYCCDKCSLWGENVDVCEFAAKIFPNFGQTWFAEGFPSQLSCTILRLSETDDHIYVRLLAGTKDRRVVS